MTFWKAAAVAAMLFAGAAPGHAADYPSKDITIVVGSPPGGPTDTFARLLAQPMQQKLGRAVIVENKPGASGTVAGQAALAAPADGHTLWFTTPSHFVIPTVMKSQPAFKRDAFRPIIGTMYGAGVLLANPKTPFSSLKELVTYAKANPGKLNFASSGVGSTSHIVMEMVKAQLGIDVAHIPYNGNGPATAALTSGEVDLLGGDLGSSAGALKDKTVKPIAVFALERSPVIPDVPTADETGLMPGFAPVFYLGFVTRAETDKAIVDKLNATVNEILKDKTIRERITGQQYIVMGGSPEDFSKLYENDAKQTGAIVTKLGLQDK
ncbi:Bug family tripartite tricarboxylate transporter substrate binding protein [Rhizobium rhizogenes]|uniref:Bug family tripartite tricarboxylate transporter substrate binding protein n=1 Tax=Rhizobium rhizogenes TaxID=359 RepID=UPI0015717877|nr:tripartite tricarboxylate transporter substrate binding protein [Rhizobium rhizogenes]NTI78477.1 tripartite tricarboxylate transporter substrate binding protein [Rhizobium rhizogenes]